jgi:hypothetical protein
MSKKSRTFLIIALGCFLLSVGVFSYTLYDVNQQGVRFQELKRLIGEHTAKEASYNTVQGLLTSTKGDRTQIQNFFIKENDAVSFISEIENNANIVDVTLNTNELSIIPKTTDANGVVVPGLLVVGFDFVGTQNATWEFITLLENVPYHKKITELSFVKTTDNIWKANVKMQLTLRYD